MKHSFKVFFHNFFEGIDEPVIFNIRFREPPKDTLLMEEAQKILPSFEYTEVMYFALMCKHLNDMLNFKTLSKQQFDIVYPEMVELGLGAGSFSNLRDVATLSQRILLQHDLNLNLGIKTTHKTNQKI